MAITPHETNQNIVYITGANATTRLTDLRAFTSHFKSIQNSILIATTETVNLSAGVQVMLHPESGLLDLSGSQTVHVSRLACTTNLTASNRGTVCCDIRGSKIVHFGPPAVSEATPPFISDINTMLLYKNGPQFWNSVSALTNMVESNIIVEGAGGDVHLSKHPDATVRDLRFEFRIPNGQGGPIMAIYHGGKPTGEPVMISGLRFVSVNDNPNIFFFTPNHANTPDNTRQLGFAVLKDYCLDAAAAGTQNTLIRKKHRRGRITVTMTEPYHTNGIGYITNLWVDPYTTTAPNGVKNAGKFYSIRSVEYTTSPTDGYCVDIIGFRWKPKLINYNGSALESAHVIVTKNDKEVPPVEIGSASHILDRTILSYGIIENGSFNNKEFKPIAKRSPEQLAKSVQDYSFFTINTGPVKFPHVYNEPGVKIIPIYSSENTINEDSTNLISGEDWKNPQIEIRAKGHVFYKRALEKNNPELFEGRLTGSLTEEIQLARDFNYNSELSSTELNTVEVLVSLRDGKSHCVVKFKQKEINADVIYRSIIDAYVDKVVDGHDLPVSQDELGYLKLVGDVEFVNESGGSVTVFGGRTIKNIFIGKNKELEFAVKDIGVEHEVYGSYCVVHSDDVMNILAVVYNDQEAIREVHLEKVNNLSIPVPNGYKLKISAWSLGKAGYYKELVVDKPTSLSIDWVDYTDGVIDVSINVENTLAQSELSLGLDGITLALPAGIYSVEYSKALLHRIVGTKIGLTATISGGDKLASRIDKDRYIIYLPLFKLMKKKDLSAEDICATELFIDTLNARQLNPAYIVNPASVNGRVEIPLNPILLNAQEVSNRVLKDLFTNGQFVGSTTFRMLSES